MKKAIIAKKIGMTQVFTENGALVPVTVLSRPLRCYPEENNGKRRL